ncbi:hypothetical protein LZC95_32720 [Pendulispora brunnea]|uniref:Uncharacterized protein n=1 Tax=Pendulispora brunnea TaxID=2905690 RepID=A0ABZ2K1G8_9BACT
MLKWLAAVAAFAAFAVLAIGALHMPFARPLLAKLGVGCPVTKGTPRAVDDARAIPAAMYIGKPGAPARPAAGFELEKTTLADLEAWAKRQGISCAPLRGNETLRACQDVDARALGEPPTFPPAEEVTFEFRASGTLAVVTVLRRKLPLAEANAMVAESSKRLREVLGAPAKSTGENTAAHFAKGPLQAFQEEYEFGNYAATLTETRIGDLGMLVREQYFSPVP